MYCEVTTMCLIIYTYHDFQVLSREAQELVMTIPLTEPLPSQYYVKATSDRWLGSVTCIPLSFQHLILPESHPPHTGVYCVICGFMNFTEYKKVHTYLL